MAKSYTKPLTPAALTRTTVTHGLQTGILRGVSVVVDAANYAERSILVTCFISDGSTDLQSAALVLFTEYISVNEPGVWHGHYDIEGSEIIVASAIAHSQVTLHISTSVSITSAR